MPSFLTRPIVVLTVLLTLFAVTLGIGWLYSAPGTGELYLLLGLAADFEQGCRSVHGLAWWTPNYLQGQTLAWLGSMATPLAMEVGRFLFGGAIGYKVMGLLSLIAAGLTMYRFVAALTGSEITAAWAGAAFACCPEFGIRLAGVEQFVVSSSYPFIPVIFHGLWRLRQATRQTGENGRLFAVLWVAASYGMLFLLWAKAAVLLLPPLALFALWLWSEEEAGRISFGIGLFQVAGIILVLAGLPVLPLMREQQWMTLFASDPMEMWQHSFVVKSAFSWWDRGGAVLDPAPGALAATGDAFYLGAVWIVALGVALWEVGLPGWLRTREGTLCRLFLALMLLVQWLSYGPVSIWHAHRELLLHGAGLPNWSITLLWLALAAQIAVVWKLAATWTPRRWVRVVLVLGYLFIPVFVLADRIPFFSQLRAPGAFWDVGGTFCFTVAGALALAAVVERWAPVPPSRRALVGWAAVALLCLDFSVYDVPFWHRPFANQDQVYADFQAGTRFIHDDPMPGSVIAFSDRYFYLQLPQLTGRPLHTEAGTSFYQLKWTRKLNDAGQQGPQRLREELAAAGVGFMLIDRTDPSLGADFQNMLKGLYPVAFENPAVTVLRCSPAGAPALATGRVQFSPEVDPGQALDGVGHDVWMIGPGLGLNAAKIDEIPGPSDAKSTPLPFLQPRQDDYQTIRLAPTPPGQPWVIVPESYHPDWTAEADGQALPVSRALGCYLAVRAPHDGAQVTFRFRQPWWYDGVIAVSALAWLAVLGGIGFGWVGSRRIRTPLP